ncbi:MAG: N-acetylneuraminate synthase family protein [Magnetococcales bacterium]|nr:N-acetylneuraminate synthase family protein [Magnetococcales bacterium]
MGSQQFGDIFYNGQVSIAKHIFVIGEVGINHNGSLEIAKQLIDMAKEAGCDAVKFQKRTLDIVYTQEVLDAPRDSPWGTTQREQKNGLEFGEKEYDEIDAYCKKLGIEWFASAWDIPSQLFLRRYNSSYNKVASAMMTHPEFLKEVAKEGKTTFISTGMCSYEDIDKAVAIFREANCPIVIMHSVSEYPAADELLNLSLIPELAKRYGCPVGYSGHESSVSPSTMAAMMGAVAVERHITLNRAMYGSDQSASLEKPGLTTLVGQLRKIPVVLGNGEKLVTPGEINNAGKLRYWHSPKDDMAE